MKLQDFSCRSDQNRAFGAFRFDVFFNCPENALERVSVGFAGPYPQSVVDRRHEDLAISDLPGARASSDHLDCFFREIGRDRDFDFQFWQKIHDIFGATVDFGMAFLAAVTLDLGYGHAVNADRGQRLAHLVKLEGFDNGNEELHGQAFILLQIPSARRSAGPGAIWQLFVQMTQKVATTNEN